MSLITEQTRFVGKPFSKHSAFRKTVFQLCQRVPQGKVATYGQLAKILNTSPRAVGQALKRNGLKEVPCHRIIRSDLKIGGFHGHSKSDSLFVRRKIKMLKKENVKFDAEGLVLQECVCTDDMLRVGRMVM